jgi:hypothetical protein
MAVAPNAGLSERLKPLVDVNYSDRRIDSAVLLPVLTRCLT